MQLLLWWMEYVGLVIVSCELIYRGINNKSLYFIVFIASLISSVAFQMIDYLERGYFDKFLPIALFFGFIAALIIAPIYFLVRRLVIAWFFSKEGK